MGLRKSLACPALSTLNRRMASSGAFHRMRNLHNPFDVSVVRQARSKARKTMARAPAPQSTHPITKDILLKLVDASGTGLRGLRDRTILLLSWASGGRRRSEIVRLNREDIELKEFAHNGLIWITLRAAKTTDASKPQKLVLKGYAARMLMDWINAAQIEEGPLFRRITRTGALGQKRLSGAAVSQIVKRLLAAAGLDPAYASAHGLRSGFLIQAAQDGAPLPAAMRLSLHQSAAQVRRYYDEVNLPKNPAADLLELPEGR